MGATVAFWVLGVLAVGTGMLVFRVDSMARATFLLLASFLCVGGELLLLGSDFLGGILVLMLTGEMVVMTVFMIMFMMNPGGLMPMTMVHNRRFSLVAAVGTFAALAAGVFAVDWPTRRGAPPADVTAALGQALMGEKMLVMMAAGVALFATMVAAILLATARGRYDRYGDELDARRPDDPIPGGLRPPPPERTDESRRVGR
jgi:NADH-quinone oxidoreductase subunit J